MLVPAITSTGIRCSSSHCSDPISDSAIAAPPPSATPITGRFFGRSGGGTEGAVGPSRSFDGLAASFTLAGLLPPVFWLFWLLPDASLDPSPVVPCCPVVGGCPVGVVFCAPADTIPACNITANATTEAKLLRKTPHVRNVTSFLRLTLRFSLAGVLLTPPRQPRMAESQPRPGHRSTTFALATSLRVTN